MADSWGQGRKRGKAESTGKSEHGGKGAQSCFLFKVYDILEDGSGFLVKKPNEFAAQVLPSYFKHHNYASFVRQLNMYDFHKRKDSGFENAFSHPMFCRGRRDHIPQIKRKTTTPAEPELFDRTNDIINELQGIIERLESRVVRLESKEAELASLRSENQKLSDFNGMLLFVLAMVLPQSALRKELTTAPDINPSDSSLGKVPPWLGKEGGYRMPLCWEDLSKALSKMLGNVALPNPNSGIRAGLPSLPMIEPAASLPEPGKPTEARNNEENEASHSKTDRQQPKDQNAYSRQGNDNPLLSPLPLSQVSSPLHPSNYHESPLHPSDPNLDKLPPYLSGIEMSPWRNMDSMTSPLHPGNYSDYCAGKDGVMASPLLSDMKAASVDLLHSPRNDSQEAKVGFPLSPSFTPSRAAQQD